LNKRKRDIPPKATQLGKILGEILSKLKEYSATLTPKEAGVSILGFHHQRQYFFLLMRYRKLLKKRKEQGKLDEADQKELDALEDYKNRTHFDVSLLAYLPDEETPETPKHAYLDTLDKLGTGTVLGRPRIRLFL
jgi:hypothetical protein